MTQVFFFQQLRKSEPHLSLSTISPLFLSWVSQSANASEIKKAYFKLSLKHHPDKNPDPKSKNLFVKIANADEAINMVKKTPAYKNRLKALELEHSGGVTNKRKGHKQMDKKVEDDLSNELELQIQGAAKPSMWNLFAVQFLLLLYALGKMSR